MRGSTAEDVAVQPDGEIVFVGRSFNGSNDDFSATRLNVDGSREGTQLIDFGGDDIAAAVKIDDAGRFYVVGTVTDPRNSVTDPIVQRVGLTRFTTAGIDYQTTFSLGGVSDIIGRDLILQPGGRVVIAGHTLPETTEGSPPQGRDDIFVARFIETGELDITFGGPGGIQFGNNVTDLGARDFVGGIINTPGGDGFIVSGGSGNPFGGAAGAPVMVAVKYTDNGRLDTSFGLNGVARVGNFGSGTSIGVASISPGPGRRFVLAGGTGFPTARLLLAGANVVSVGALDGLAGEGTTNTALLAVGHIERLPFPTRVYISIGGTAVGRTPALAGTLDYTLDKVVQPLPTFGNPDTRPYVEIPANETFVFVTLTTLNDTRIEGSESATFSIIADASYEIGTPSTGTVTITDDDRLTFTIGTSTVTPPPKHVEEGQEVRTAVTWTVPSGGWRQLSSVRLRLRDLDDGDALVLLTFDEATNSFSLDATAAAADGRVSLLPEKCTFSAAGPAAPRVTVTFTYHFNAAAAAHRFAVDVSADNDAGDASGFSEVAKVFVRKKSRKDHARRDVLLP